MITAQALFNGMITRNAVALCCHGEVLLTHVQIHSIELEDGSGYKFIVRGYEKSINKDRATTRGPIKLYINVKTQRFVRMDCWVGSAIKTGDWS